MMEKPKTQRGMVEQLWFVVIGSNGEGVVELIKQALAQMVDHATRLGKIENLLPALWTKEQHEKMHEAYVAEEEAKKEKADEKKDRRGITTRDWIMIAIVALGIFIPDILRSILGKHP